MKKIACLFLLSALLAGSISAQVVSDPEQVRDLSLSLKTNVGFMLGVDMDMPVVYGVGAEVEYFQNRKWLLFASAQNLTSVFGILEGDGTTFFKDHGYFDLGGGYSLMSFETSKEKKKKITVKKSSYLVDTLYWVKNDINDITKHNMLVRGGLHITGNTITNYSSSELAQGQDIYDYGTENLLNQNYRVLSPYLGVEYRFTKGYRFILNREFNGYTEQYSIFADVFITSFLDDNVEFNSETSSENIRPGIVREDHTGDLVLDKFGYRIGFKNIGQAYKSANLGWALEVVSQPDVRKAADASNKTIIMYTILYTL
ncbi:MAG: hypothetical protein ACQES0_07630 [Bacteroidota bacterium]